MSNAEAWTTKRLLDWTTDFLKQHGSDSPRLDAEVLLAEAKKCQRIELYTAYDQVPPEDQLAVFRKWIKERADGKPVAYLVGHREFYSLPFHVNEHVLIPRPETELLVTLAIDHLAATPEQSPLVCDVGTGSGCIAIAIARNHADCQVTAVDVSKPAIELAAQNAENLKVADRIQFLQSDLLEQLTDPVSFDLIVSNPPYIGLQEQESLSRDVRDHEPELALYGGQDGTELTSRLLNQAVSRLKPGGRLIYETSPLIIDRCLQLTNAIPELNEVQIHSDLAKQPRVVSAIRDST